MLTANRVRRIFDSLHDAPWEGMPRWSNMLPWDQSDSFFTPAFDGTETLRHRIWTAEDAVMLELDLPGRQLEDIDVSVEQDRVLISTSASQYECDGELNFHIRERSNGKESFQFRLPFPIQADKTDVVYHDGLLQIRVGKPEEELPRKLEVKQA
jgi:HSP20 family protein